MTVATAIPEYWAAGLKGNLIQTDVGGLYRMIVRMKLCTPPVEISCI